MPPRTRPGKPLTPEAVDAKIRAGKSEAWVEGYRAGYNRATITTNPYAAPDEEPLP